MVGDIRDFDGNPYEEAFEAFGAFGCTHEVTERRRDARSPFRSYQWIALQRDKAMPKPTEFEQYQCYDISASGFSFLTPTRLNAGAVVVAIVAIPTILYMAATVVHCTQVLAYPSGRVDPVLDKRRRPRSSDQSANEPARMFLIGCRFTHRLHPPQ